MAHEELSCDHAIRDIKSWVVEHVNKATLRKLKGNDTLLEEVSVKIYDTIALTQKDSTLCELLGRLSSWREHPSTRGTHLSALRSAMRQIASDTPVSAMAHAGGSLKGAVA